MRTREQGSTLVPALSMIVVTASLTAALVGGPAGHLKKAGNTAASHATQQIADAGIRDATLWIHMQHKRGKLTTLLPNPTATRCYVRCSGMPDGAAATTFGAMPTANTDASSLTAATVEITNRGDYDRDSNGVALSGARDAAANGTEIIPAPKRFGGGEGAYYYTIRALGSGYYQVDVLGVERFSRLAVGARNADGSAIAGTSVPSNTEVNDASKVVNFHTSNALWWVWRRVRHDSKVPHHRAMAMIYLAPPVPPPTMGALTFANGSGASANDPNGTPTQAFGAQVTFNATQNRNFVAGDGTTTSVGLSLPRQPAGQPAVTYTGNMGNPVKDLNSPGASDDVSVSTDISVYTKITDAAREKARSATPTALNETAAAPEIQRFDFTGTDGTLTYFYVKSGATLSDGDALSRVMNLANGLVVVDLQPNVTINYSGNPASSGWDANGMFGQNGSHTFEGGLLLYQRGALTFPTGKIPVIIGNPNNSLGTDAMATFNRGFVEGAIKQINASDFPKIVLTRFHD